MISRAINKKKKIRSHKTRKRSEIFRKDNGYLVNFQIDELLLSLFFYFAN